ncbi:hypothetical protein PTKIN_Ptkin02bG0179000 [Pterospermum kingtungense]
MGSISFTNCQTLKLFASLDSFRRSKQPCIVSLYHHSHTLVPSLSLPNRSPFRRAAGLIANSVPSRNGNYTVGDFMTRKEDLHVVKTTTSVDEALEALVEKRVTGFPVIDDDWKLVGVVSDYDLLALDSISGSSQNDTTMFPNVDSTWKTFNQLQQLMSKNNGKVVGDLMTPSPLVVREKTNLEDAARFHFASHLNAFVFNLDVLTLMFLYQVVAGN